MSMRSGTLLAFCAALLVVATTMDANAGHRTHGRPHIVKRIHIKNNIRIVDQRVVVNFDRDRQKRHFRRQVNTYSGDVAIEYRRHVGAWSYGSVSAPASTMVERPGARIIDIDKLGGRNDCSMEQGVCVIRP